MKKLILVPFLLTSCVTAQLVKDDGALKTIRVNSGRIGEKIYQAELQERAEQACSKGFEVLEKTKTPSTLPEPDVHDFYWVIKCR